MKRKHPKAEIAPSLRKLNELATQGKLRSEIARALGVSVMTLHRWRKLSTAAPQHANGSSERDQAPQTRIAELQLENSRLRRLVTDLLLEKMSIEEASQDERSTRVGPLMRPSCQSRVAPFSSPCFTFPAPPPSGGEASFAGEVCATAPRAHDRFGALTAQRPSSVERCPEADRERYGCRSVSQAAHIHVRGSCIPYWRPTVRAPTQR
jgi:putative transposase